MPAKKIPGPRDAKGRPAVRAVCHQCGADFLARKDRTKTPGKGRFCSHSCSSRFRIEHLSEEQKAVLVARFTAFTPEQRSVYGKQGYDAAVANGVVFGCVERLRPHKAKAIAGIRARHQTFAWPRKSRTPEGRRAYTKIQKLVKLGRLEKKWPCSACGDVTKRTVAHHEDYSRPLDVIWICDTCHLRHHKNPDQRVLALWQAIAGEAVTA